LSIIFLVEAKAVAIHNDIEKVSDVFTIESVHFNKRGGIFANPFDRLLDIDISVKGFYVTSDKPDSVISRDGFVIKEAYNLFR